jgi:hypothetical protein
LIYYVKIHLYIERHVQMYSVYVIVFMNSELRQK